MSHGCVLLSVSEEKTAGETGKGMCPGPEGSTGDQANIWLSASPVLRRDLGSRPGADRPCSETWSLNHWASREVPQGTLSGRRHPAPVLDRRRDPGVPSSPSPSSPHLASQLDGSSQGDRAEGDPQSLKVARTRGHGDHTCPKGPVCGGGAPHSCDRFSAGAVRGPHQLTLS